MEPGKADDEVGIDGGRGAQHVLQGLPVLSGPFFAIAGFHQQRNGTFNLAQFLAHAVFSRLLLARNEANHRGARAMRDWYDIVWSGSKPGFFPSVVSPGGGVG